MFSTELLIRLADPINWGNPLANGLIGWWLATREGSGGLTWYDLCGLSHATIVTTTGGTQSGWFGGDSRSGRRARVRLNVTGDYVSIPNSGLFDTTAGTIAFWIRATFQTLNTVVSRFDSSGHGGFAWQSAAGPSLSMNFFNAAGTSVGSLAGSLNVVGSGGGNGDNIWHLVLGRWAGTASGSTISYSIDGALTGSTTLSGAWTLTAGQPIRLGVPLSGSGATAKVEFDGVQVWSRYLSNAEVGQLYQESVTGYPNLLNYVEPSFQFIPVFASTGFQSIPDRAPGPRRAAESAYLAPFPSAYPEDLTFASAGFRLLPDRAPGPLRAAESAYLAPFPMAYPGDVLPVPAVGRPVITEFARGPRYATFSAYDALLSSPVRDQLTFATAGFEFVTDFAWTSRRASGSAYWIVPYLSQHISSFDSEANVFDSFTGQILLPNPDQSPGQVMFSPVDPDFPFTYVETPTSVVLMANGVDPVLKWDPLTKKSTTAGVIAPTTALTLDSTPFTNTDADGNVIPNPSYWGFYRYVDQWGNPSSLSPISNESLGGPPFFYSGIVPPTEFKVTTIQIFRNTSGQATIYYLDGEITDFLQTTFTSALTDDELQLNLPFAVEDVDGTSFLNLYDPPPSWKSCIEYQIGRTFLAVDVEYKRGCVQVNFQSLQVYGIDTNWKVNFAGRAFYAAGSPEYYIIDSVDEDNQILTLAEPYAGATNYYASYTIRPQPIERRLVYYSESGLPEAWPPTNAIEVHEDGDDLTGLVAFNSFLYIVERRHIYRFTYQKDPATDGFIFNSTNRGCINQRCIVQVEDAAWMLDEQGIHKFTGGEAQPVSEPVQDLFQPGLADTASINWDADKTLWHASWDPERETIRWFVTFGVDPEPRDAICFQYRLNRFWIEHYERPITSSTTAMLEAYRSFVGSSARRILCLSQGTLDGVLEDPSYVQGSIVSAGPTTFTVSPLAYVPQPLVGYTVGIVSGQGGGQVRTITSISGQKVWVDRPWGVIPDSTSTYQFGAFPYFYQTGWFRFTDDEAGNPRDVEMIYAPTAYPASIHVRQYYNYSVDPRQWVIDRTQDGVTYSTRRPEVQVSTKGYGGYTILRQEGHKEIYIGGDLFVSVSLAGVSSLQPIQVRSLTISGTGA